MNFPKDETGKVLFEMQKAGIDLTTMHTIVFFHLFETLIQLLFLINLFAVLVLGY